MDGQHGRTALACDGPVGLGRRRDTDERYGYDVILLLIYAGGFRLADEYGLVESAMLCTLRVRCAAGERFREQDSSLSVVTNFTSGVERDGTASWL